MNRRLITTRVKFPEKMRPPAFRCVEMASFIRTFPEVDKRVCASYLPA